METKTVKASLVDKIQEGPAVKRFSFKTDQDFSYKAGQWGFFEFEKSGKKFSKPLSFCNCPSTGTLECTTLISDSEYKQALDAMNLGDSIEIRGPFGNFTLDSLKKDKLCFLAGGIGITPFMSMLQYAQNTKMSLDAVLFYSNRTRDRIVFEAELAAMAQKMPKLKVIHTLTDLSPEEKAQWKGETGYISAAMIKKHMSDYSERHFFMVGPPPFNKAIREMLSGELGIDNTLITAEQFAGY